MYICWLIGVYANKYKENLSKNMKHIKYSWLGPNRLDWDILPVLILEPQSREETPRETVASSQSDTRGGCSDHSEVKITEQSLDSTFSFVFFKVDWRVYHFCQVSTFFVVTKMNAIFVLSKSSHKLMKNTCTSPTVPRKPLGSQSSNSGHKFLYLTIFFVYIFFFLSKSKL